MLSRLSYFFCLLLMLYASFCFYPRWKQPETQAAIAWDVAGYYWYLPSIFIYKDLKHQHFANSIINKYKPSPDFQEAFMDSASGNYVMKYSSGMAVMFLPYFAIAHIIATQFGYPADGFSAPYQLAIQVGGLIMSLIGLWYFRKFLKIYYGDTVTALCLIVLVVGTNYLNYGAIDTGMSHTWLFTLYVFLLLVTHAFYKKPSIKYAAVIGFLTGLLTLSRPTETLSLLIPLLWGLESLSGTALKQRIAFFKANVKAVAVAGACAAVVVSVQLIYWKSVSGHWVVYSYQDQGFSWLHPHWYDYALSFKCGWLAYTPVMMLAFIGIISYVRYGTNKVMVITFFFLNFYIVCSWDIWWFGGRAMVQSYPILMLPIASLLEVMLRKKTWLFILTPVFVLFVYIGLWFTYIEHAGGVYDDDINNPYYWNAVGRFHVPEETHKLLDRCKIFNGVPRNKKLIYENNFENDSNTNCTLPPVTGARSVCLSKDHQYSKSYMFPYTPGTSAWVRAEATFTRPQDEWDRDRMAQFFLRFFNKGAEVQMYMIRIDRFMHEQHTCSLWIDATPPKQPFDSIGISFYNGGQDKIIEADDLKVWSFD